MKGKAKETEPKAVWDWIIQPIHLWRGCLFHLPRDLQEWQDLPGRQDTLGSLSDWETWGWKADSVSPKWNAPTEISQGETRNTSTEMEWHDLHGCQSWEHPDFVGVPNIPSMLLELRFFFQGVSGERLPNHCQVAHPHAPADACLIYRRQA